MEVQLLHPDAVAPFKAYDGDAGYDLVSIEDMLLKKGCVYAVRTGVAVKMPVSVYGRIAPRSSMGLKNIIVNGGVVDNGFRGEIKVILVSLSCDYLVKKGDKIAQLVLEVYKSVPVKIVNKLSTTTRSDKGFGSSGI